ncbi:MAG: type II toxin-antitoxin system Phd/YefM family antitoxin [Chloroflexota bacterium]|nr:MAG: type II toxin-antitoxin system Phd/YefM family antitoxin [Chloroflexota bacterium]
MARIDTANLVSISEASKRGILKLANDAAGGHEQILMRNNKPVAAVVGMDRLNELDELQRLEEDMLDIVLATARMVDDNGKRYSLDDVLKHFGYTREELRGVAE